MLPYVLVPAVGILVFYAWRHSAGSGNLAAGVYLGGGLLISLVLLRQVFTIVENARLYNRLRGTYVGWNKKATRWNRKTTNWCARKASCAGRKSTSRR